MAGELWIQLQCIRVSLGPKCRHHNCVQSKKMTKKPEGGQVAFVGEDHLVGDNLDPGMIKIEPPRDLAVGDNEDLPHPRGVFFN